jgi:hypothetical protein
MFSVLWDILRKEFLNNSLLSLTHWHFSSPSDISIHVQILYYLSHFNKGGKKVLSRSHFHFQLLVCFCFLCKLPKIFLCPPHLQFLSFNSLLSPTDLGFYSPLSTEIALVTVSSVPSLQNPSHMSFILTWSIKSDQPWGLFLLSDFSRALQDLSWALPLRLCLPFLPGESHSASCRSLPCIQLQNLCFQSFLVYAYVFN